MTPWCILGRPSPQKRLMKKDWNASLGAYSPTPRLGGQYPAKFRFNSPASCSDFVVYTTGGAVSTTTPTVIAYIDLYGSNSPTHRLRELYGHCPDRSWSYNTSNGTASSATLSPVISLIGDQVAYVQNTSTAASLVILRKSNTGTLTHVAAGSYKICTAPCYTTLAFAGTHLDSNSAPFYDYSHDSIWVGDDAGNLHEFTNVFLGSTTPAESGSTPFAAVSTAALTSPVYDAGTGLVFVFETGSVTATPFHSVCGVTGINSICTSAGTLTSTSSSVSISYDSGTTANDGPVVDSSISKAYVFAGNDGSGACTNGTNSFNCVSVFQFTTTTSLSSQTSPTKAIVGRSEATHSIPLYAGAFNDGYYTGGSSTGALYVCGSSPNGSATQGILTLYKIAISGGAMGTAVAQGPAISTATGSPSCSPVTEFPNGANDYLFLSVSASGAATGCSGDCLYGYTIPTSFTTSLTPNAGLAVTSGASGTIIDNTGALAGSSQIYFYSLAAEACPTSSTGCAVQASQAAP